ncbi:hypothetical protein [Streptomyces yokosukanensis]|uniref:hypothetical protein n=1 Tax=Streptomyces yokosukanensis TaxID=67386 RepID=UPI000A748F8B|nr:hypothetical protein [Streptomyces yokosukanensis]
MRWLLFGILLGLLLLIPSVFTFAGAVVAWLLDKPVFVAFVLGAAARPHLPRLRGWVR